MKKYRREAYTLKLNPVAQLLAERRLLRLPLSAEYFEPAPDGWVQTAEPTLEGWDGEVLIEVEEIKNEP